MRWAVVAGCMKVGKVASDDNLADTMTKILSTIKRDHLFGNWTY